VNALNDARHGEVSRGGKKCQNTGSCYSDYSIPFIDGNSQSGWRGNGKSAVRDSAFPGENVESHRHRKKIQNNIVYLENNKGYNLSNVKITEAYDRNSRISEKKRMAEMLFINGTLREVTIR
jgi:hypothetical protein